MYDNTSLAVTESYSGVLCIRALICSVYASGVCYTYCMYLSSCLSGFLLLSDFVSN